jgi:hypothetical protein
VRANWRSAAGDDSNLPTPRRERRVGAEEREAALERGVGEEKAAVELGGGDAGYGGVGRGTPPALRWTAGGGRPSAGRAARERRML